MRARARVRFQRYLDLDAGGAWVAVDGEEIVGTSIAILREGIWGSGALRGRREPPGEGDRQAAAGRRAARTPTVRAARWIMSSEDPKALRRYSLAGFELRPCVVAAGVLRTDLPAGARRHRGARSGDRHRACGADLARRAGREPRRGPRPRPGRRSAHAHAAGRLRHPRGRRGARSSPRSTATPPRCCLRRAFAQAPRGATVQVDLITAGQDWAIRTCLHAGLALSPGGAVFTRGDVGPMRPYLPTGALCSSRSCELDEPVPARVALRARGDARVRRR